MITKVRSVPRVTSFFLRGHVKIYMKCIKPTRLNALKQDETVAMTMRFRFLVSADNNVSLRTWFRKTERGRSAPLWRKLGETEWLVDGDVWTLPNVKYRREGYKPRVMRGSRCACLLFTSSSTRRKCHVCLLITAGL